MHRAYEPYLRQISQSLLSSPQKRAVCIITFLKPDEHSGPLIKELEILKLILLPFTMHSSWIIIIIIFFHLLLQIFFRQYHPYTHTTHTIPGLLSNQPIISIPSKQTMVNSTFTLQLQKFGITLKKALNTSPLKRLKQSQVKSEEWSSQ